MGQEILTPPVYYPLPSGWPSGGSAFRHETDRFQVDQETFQFAGRTDDAARGQRIKDRRLDGATVAAEIFGGKVIGVQDDDIGTLGGVRDTAAEKNASMGKVTFRVFILLGKHYSLLSVGLSVKFTWRRLAR